MSQNDDLTFALNPGEVDEPQEANQVLLGKIISRNRLGKAAIQGSLKLSWNAIKGWKWKEIENGIIQFTFAKWEDALNVLARRPWFVCGALLVIMPWPAWLSPTEVRFDKTPIWVRIESIPPFYWNLSNLKELASKASPVYELPPGVEDAVGMSTLRFRATIDINKPIFSGFFLRRQRLKDLWIQYKYERLPKLFFKCGVLTHDQSICFKSPTIIKDANGNIYPMFGVWLKSDSIEKSTFLSPLAKWFQDWLFKDPTLRNQVKIHKAIQNGEAAEIRECRRQLPGKKRIVSDENEHSGEANFDLVITQMPLVYLPSIGEIAPYGNNTKIVSIQGLQEAAEKFAAANVLGDSNMQPNELFGSQAQFIGWPSKKCWADPKARELIMGALTIDKFHREPTLFNPICDIEDFRVQEHLDGPRKRKASDGIIFSPNSQSDQTQNLPTQLHHHEITSSPFGVTGFDNGACQSQPSQKLFPEEISQSSFSPGSSVQPKTNSSKRKGKETVWDAYADQGRRKRRGRAPKTQSPLAATTKSFKGGRKAKVSTGGKTVATSHWHDRTFDLKYCIIGEISSDPPGIPWILVGTYDPPNSVDKESFW
ncbi:hypothetical protein F8388_004589 [Cannabis sativa]|uniref:DUF4283 domain-containing protein n=1 Tax=Cannabis sativa TaxID=3483 RepID=A0A7J6GN52_CANSA|nr:hypothetical protein F8388_004589 [Cannabis sativa]